MTGQVIHFGAPAHHAAEELLPWYVNGTLDAGERARVQEHLDQCAHCQHEVQSLRAFHAAYAGPDSTAPADPAPSLRRLRSRLTPSRSRAGRRFWRPLQGWLRTLHLPRPPQSPHSRRWLGLALAAQFAAIAVLGVMLAGTTEQSPAYRTLGAAGPAENSHGNLVVVFDPQSSEAELRRILRATGSRIVDGPTSTHAYVLQIEPARQADILAALRAEPRVALAERLEGGR